MYNLIFLDARRDFLGVLIKQGLSIMVKPLHYDVTGQLCILSIDDDEVNLMVIEQLLRPNGWKVNHHLVS